MTKLKTFLAVFIGSPASPRWTEWHAMDDANRKIEEVKGIEAWKAWAHEHRDAIVDEGGPLGRTMRISQTGIADVRNELTAFVMVRAQSHDAAAKMFEGHPHFMIFAGEAVDVMPVLPIPGA